MKKEKEHHMLNKFLQVLIVGIFCIVLDGGKSILHGEQFDRESIESGSNEVDCHKLLRDCEWSKCESFEDVSREARSVCLKEFSESDHQKACEAGCGVLQYRDLCTITDCSGNSNPRQRQKIDFPGWS